MKELTHQEMIDKGSIVNDDSGLNTRPNDAKWMIAEGWDAVSVAMRFHYHYEKMAPVFGYETRAETKVFDPTSKNGRLMIAVCEQMLLEICKQSSEGEEG